MKQHAISISALTLMLGTAMAAEVLNLSGSFDGWRQAGDANWRIEDGAFVADAGKGHLVTERSFGDFRATVEFWVSPDANSGIYFRISQPDAIADSSAYEANIFDQRPDPTYATGALVHFSPPATPVTAGGKWNTYEITAQGDSIRIVLNGVTTVETRDATYQNGPLSLQYMAGTVKFRKVEIEEL